MSLKKEFVRNGERKIIGSVTSGFPDGVSVVRDEHNHYIGKTSDKFNTTRDEHSRLVSTNTSDAGLLINRKK